MNGRGGPRARVERRSAVAEIKVRQPKAWERLARAIVEIERSLSRERAEDLRRAIVASAFRDGVLGREEESGVRPLPVSEAAE